jgi:hypothetical protein
MENQELLDSIIEDIAALLATGYFRLRRGRVRNESAAPPVLESTDERLDSANDQSPHAAMRVIPTERGDRL